MYNNLDFLAKEELNCIPGDIVHLLLKATQNIAYYSGLIRGYSHGEILKKVRYLINYKNKMLSKVVEKIRVYKGSIETDFYKGIKGR